MDEPDWESWEPTQRAALCFVRRGGRLLLILKKRGLGAGKITAPGGRIRPGEDAQDAAVRETREETGVTPGGVSRAGELLFQFKDGLALHCTVFIARSGTGDPVETEEAVPLWTEDSAIPYAKMWADDALWMPWMLKGRLFRGFFCYEGSRMLTSRLEPA
ncbi:MAG: 8-oxo-dGTP diphosphatase [Elusimicrobia bacterium]|nr:8-oxo-dGTP diphosphatase [Elusimicrobiota bacterium]